MTQRPHMRRALIEGDWYVTEGSFFADAWNPRLHICKPFHIPRDWPRWRSMDWGYNTGRSGACSREQYGFRWSQSSRLWPIAYRYARTRPRWLGMDSLCSEEWARIVEPLLVGPWWGDP